LIRRLLVANRGEIAARIVRTASAMGIETVAVFAEGDAAAPYVTAADRAVRLPGRSAAETYLDVDALLAAASTAGADAVHPGYGFLSERGVFARAVLAAGFTWVGPPPDVIDAMGDKLAAKRIMAGAGVPVLPSWEPGDTGVAFPVLVKAAAGGGGKGMRIVWEAGDLDGAVAAARREAEAAFGDGTVFLERFVPIARHVEIQILADDHGGAIHCFERECSIQRRHQKVIEEAPSPAVDDDLRERMGSAALAAAKAVGYRNAGTVEFVLEPTGEFWFLEVNTRLHVEHPVTEAITGLDLVREQLRIAQGLPISVAQADLAIDGHAVEARLYAEAPAAGFLPATGTLVDWAPATEPAVRWDSGIGLGSEIGVEFDPLLAKVISHASTRAEAALRLARALERSRIRGFDTNRDFLVAALRHPDFLAGRTTTDFIERSGVALARRPEAAEVRLAATAASLASFAASRVAAPVLGSLPGAWRNSVMPPERRIYEHDGETTEASYSRRRDGTFRFGDGLVRLRAVDGGWVEFEEDGLVHRLHVAVDGHRVWVQGPDGDLELAETPRFPEGESGDQVAGGLAAPMPGKIVSVEVTSGEEVAAGQVLLILEAMKMEHRVLAPHAGVVGEVRAAAGDQVRGGDLLVVLQESPGAE
jgi:propionyl-CoA carboxylase alpha chain